MALSSSEAAARGEARQPRLDDFAAAGRAFHEAMAEHNLTVAQTLASLAAARSQMPGRRAL
jgi:hypothetical protein